MPPSTARLAPVPKGRNPEEFYEGQGLADYYAARLAETEEPKARAELAQKLKAAKIAAAITEANVDTEPTPIAKVTK